VPTDDYEQLKRWCGYRAALSWGRPDPDDQVEIAGNLVAYRRYLRELVEAKVEDRADDLTSDLLAIHDEDPERLTLAEIASILFSLSFAGHETTTGLIGNTVRRLLEEPARWDALVAEPALIPAAVQETLRYDPSVPVWRRVTTRPATLAGIDLPEGTKVLLWLAATGRDPSVFPDPDRFDLHRTNADKHLAFGAGLHYCLGASLGKLEARLAVEELIHRFPTSGWSTARSSPSTPTSPSAAPRHCGYAAVQTPPHEGPIHRDCPRPHTPDDHPDLCYRHLRYRHRRVHRRSAAIDRGRAGHVVAAGQLVTSLGWPTRSARRCS